MTTSSARQTLSNLYGLMMEINLHQSDEDVLKELQENPDSQIEKHLLQVKQMTTKLKAEANKSRFQVALNQLKELKEKGIEELRKFIQPSEQAEFVPLFRKFEELTEKDEHAILEDQELLRLLKILKEKVDDRSNG